MLLNLSNHASAQWGERQLALATAQYGSVVDLPFPAIDPTWSRDQVDQLAETYSHTILRDYPSARAVHLMGELTFCFHLAERLRALGLPAIASTTQRLVRELAPGKKEAHFEFVQFRAYY